MASSSKSCGKAKRSTQLEISEADDCLGSSNDKESIHGKRMKRSEWKNLIIEKTITTESNDSPKEEPNQRTVLEQLCADISSEESCSFTSSKQQGDKLLESNESNCLKGNDSDKCDFPKLDTMLKKEFCQCSEGSDNNESCYSADLRQEVELTVPISDTSDQNKNMNEKTMSNNCPAPDEDLMNGIVGVPSTCEAASLEDNFSLKLSHRSSCSDIDSDQSSDKAESIVDSDLSSDKADSKGDNDHTYGKLSKEKIDEIRLDPTPKTPKPKHKWVAPFAITARQYGFPQNYSQDCFRYNCYGSLHMVERLELMDKMKRHDGCVNALNFNSTGTKLASGSDDLDIVVWDWTIGEPILDYNSGHRSNVFQAKFMPLSEDSYIVSCGRDGQVRVGELSSTGECRKTRKLAQHKGAAHKLALQMDSPHTFLSCGEDATVFGIDLRKEKPEKLVVCKSNEKKVPLYSIFVNPLKSVEYAVSGRSQFVKVYDTRFIDQNSGFLKSFCPEHLVSSETANVTSVVYNYNGEELLASYNDEDIYSFSCRETDSSKFLHRYKGHRNSQTVKGVNYFGTKSEFVISGSDCGYIFFWDRETEHVVKYMYGDEGGVVNCLEPNPTMPVLATSGLDDDIKIWVPSCEIPPDLSGLRKHLISNMREREEERRDCPEAFIDQTIWFLMQHLARSRGRRTTRRPEDPVMEMESSSDSESPDEEEAEFRREIQCNQS